MAIGFRHEQNHPAAGAHLTVNWTNIRPKHAHNFQPLGESGAWKGGPYEAASFMHYAPNVWPGFPPCLI